MSPENEQVRNTKLLNFARPGNPGAKFKGPFEKMLKAITIPKAVKEELGLSDDAIGDAFILQNKAVVDVIPDDAETKKDGEDEDEDGGSRKKRPTEEEKAAVEARLLK